MDLNRSLLQSDDPSRPEGETNPSLYYKEIGRGLPIVILHGLLGSSNNWQAIAKRMSSDFRLFLIDQRNHGRSFHSTRHTYRLLAEDLFAFTEIHGLEKVRLLGHSMGGKAAMTFALMFPQKVERLIVVDIAPRAYSSSHDEILDSLNDLNLEGIFSRTEADRMLAPRIPNQRVRQFLLTNLKRRDQGSYSWRMNLSALRKNRRELTKALEFANPCNVPALFIRGEDSTYIEPSDLAHIRRIFPTAILRTIPGAGHWVHADAPKDFVHTVREFLS